MHGQDPSADLLVPSFPDLPSDPNRPEIVTEQVQGGICMYN